MSGAGKRVSYRRSNGGWEGVHRDEQGRVVWACGHRHSNRDISKLQYGQVVQRSAQECARTAIDKARGKA